MGDSTGSAAAPGNQEPITGEWELIQRAQAGDPQALAAIYFTYYPKVYSYGLAHLANVEAAEDLASEVMLKVLESIPRYRFRGVAFAAWVFRIARNLLIDLQRRRNRRREVDLVESASIAHPATDALVERAINRCQLRTVLGMLTSEQRQVMLLRFIEGHDNESVSRILGRSESAVKSLQHRALNSMRRAMIPRNGRRNRGASSAVPAEDRPSASPAALSSERSR